MTFMRHGSSVLWIVSTAEAALYVREAKALLGHFSVRVVGGRCLRAMKTRFNVVDATTG